MQETQEFDPWVGKIPWRRKWQPTPVFLPGESHGQERSLAGSKGLFEKTGDAKGIFLAKMGTIKDINCKGLREKEI